MAQNLLILKQKNMGSSHRQTNISMRWKMGIFTRFKDIIASNINSMLDKAENPEKLIKLMIREMEDTLIELKTSCANAIASQKKAERLHDDICSREKFWEGKAGLAVKKNKDDLARKALQEKQYYRKKAESVESELDELESIVYQYQSDIRELEDKLNSAREKQRVLVQRHVRARNRKKAMEEVRRADSVEVMQKFDELENHIEYMEAEAELAGPMKSSGLEAEFEALETNDEIEAELSRLKSSLSAKNDVTTDA